MASRWRRPDGRIHGGRAPASTSSSWRRHSGCRPQPRQARLVGSYPAGDLAVIQVDDRSGLRPASFGDSDKAQVGDVVLAARDPGETVTVTVGRGGQELAVRVTLGELPGG